MHIILHNRPVPLMQNVYMFNVHICSFRRRVNLLYPFPTHYPEMLSNHFAFILDYDKANTAM